MNKKQEDKFDISNLREIMAKLRDPDHGCPWDREQTFRSIAPYTVEEAFEVADAIERDALDELPDELGDLLLQVVFHARMAEEAGRFDFDDVVGRICDKLLRRHPHVFAEREKLSAAAQSREWEAIKQRERGEAGGILAGVPRNLPALARAAKLGRRASRVGFDWRSVAPVRAKIDEEVAEVDVAISSGSTAQVEAEIGDLLFAIVNLCRHFEVDPEQCLRGANRRFETRFAAVEQAVAASGRDWTDFGLDELDAFWRAAKARETDLDG